MSTEDLSKESKETDVICAVCLRFEPQAWRKKFCRNCFHSIDEHTSEGEKESGQEKEENEKNVKKTGAEKDNQISKDKSVKDDKNKSNKPSTDKLQPEKDKATFKSEDKTSAITQKKFPASGGSGKVDLKKSTDEKETDKKEEKDKVSVTDKFKGKSEKDKKTVNEKIGDKKADDKSDKLDKSDDKPKQAKTDNEKTKLWGGKAKFEQKTTENKDEKHKSNENVHLNEKKEQSVKADDKTKEPEKTKSWGAKSKFETKPQDVKDEKKQTVAKSDDKKEEKEEEKKPGIKVFKPPEKHESKLKWNKMWGSSIQEKADEKKKDDEKDVKGSKLTEKSEKETTSDLKGNTSNKDSIKSKFESKETGNLWGGTIKQKVDTKQTESVEEKVKIEDKKRLTKEDDKGKQDGVKDEKSKSWISKTSKFGASNISTKDAEEKKRSDIGKIDTKDSKKSSDIKPTNETEKTKFGNIKSTQNDKDSDKKSESTTFKKPEENLKNVDSKSKLDNKSPIWGSKSKFDSNKSDKVGDLKASQSVVVVSKTSEDKAKENKDTDEKSETENKKNEKLEGKLKLDIKKAESANKFGKDTKENTVSHSASDKLKEKYEKLSKTPTSNTETKTLENKVYSRSKSDTSVTDKKIGKDTTVTSQEFKAPLSQHKEIKGKSDKTEDTAKYPSIKPTRDQEEEFSSDEVKDEATSQSKESLPKLNTDDINKIKEAAKFLLEDDLDDGRYDSLGRKGIGYKSTGSQQATTSLRSSANLKRGDKKSSVEPGSSNRNLVHGKTATENKAREKHDVENVFNEKFNSEAERLRKQLKQMEEKCTTLEEENTNLKNGLLEKEKHSGRLMKQKQDVENSIKVLQKSLTSIESKCSKLETENTNLQERIKIAQSKCDGKSASDLKTAHMEEMKHLQDRLKTGESIVEELRDDNENLKQEVLDLKNEMEEMYDTFRDQEAEEFRDVQREMEMHAKNCRVLSFKLRKYERLQDQWEAEKENYEDKLQMLQNQISDGDTRAHVRDIEDELRLAKEVSVRLHDELDILEERKCKVEDENSQLTQILEQSDKKQFKLELEVDKLRDQIAELKKKIAEKSTPGTPVPQEDMKDRRL